MATGFGYDPERRAAQAELVRALLPQVRDIRRAGAAALDLAWLAAGRLDGFYEHGLKRLGLGRAGACSWRRPAARGGDLPGEPRRRSVGGAPRRRAARPSWPAARWR